MSPITDVRRIRQLTRWTALFPTSPACARPAASAPASATASSTSSCARRGISARTISSISSAARMPGIGRATVYRTLQWMVDAGIARKVDFGEGRSRFEPSYRHPRHFHLDLQHLPSLVRVPQLRRRVADRGDRRRAQLRGGADGACRSSAPARSAAPAGRRRRSTARRPSWCSRATRCASRSPPSAAASSSTPRAASLTKDRARPHGLPEAGGRGARAPRHAREALSRAARRQIRSSSRGRRSCSSRARRAACSPKAPSKLRKGVDDQQALLIGIKCERGSHKFFKRYGERFEDSEGKQIFLEFADEERAHLDLLIREYRALRERQRPRAARARRRRPAARRSRRVDRSPHPHDRVRRPLHAGGARRARRGGRRHRAQRHRPRHRGRLRAAAAAACARGRHRVRRRHRDHGRASTASTCTCSATSSTPRRRRCGRFSPSSASGASTACARCRPARGARHRARRRRDPAAGARRSGRCRSGRPWIARALVAGGHVRPTQRGVRALAGARPAGVRAARRAPAPKKCSRASTTPAASRRWRIPGSSSTTSGFRRWPRAGLDALEAYHTDHDEPATDAIARWRTGSVWPCPAARTITATSRTARRPGSVSLPREDYERLVSR